MTTFVKVLSTTPHSTPDTCVADEVHTEASHGMCVITLSFTDTGAEPLRASRKLEETA